MNDENNQPVVFKDVSLVHNGILINYTDLVKDYELIVNSELDSEVIPILISNHLNEDSLIDSLKKSIKLFCGEASFAGSLNMGESYFLYTNTGSIYYLIKNNKIVFFSSEEWISKKIKNKYSISGNIKKLEPNKGLILNSEFEIVEEFVHECLGVEKSTTNLNEIIKNCKNQTIVRPVLDRCNRCILPETVPFIEFDESNICNYCYQHQLPLIGDFEDFKILIKRKI